MNVAFFDIETTNLKADFGQLLCACIKSPGKRTEVYRRKYVGNRFEDDHRIVHEIARRLRDFDVVVTYYGRGFDVPFLRSRMMKHGYKGGHTFFHIDLYFKTRGLLQLSSGRLARLQEYMGLKTSKTHLRPECWAKAASGDERSIRKIVTHCIKDVEVLEDLYERVMPYIKSIGEKVRL